MDLNCNFSLSIYTGNKQTTVELTRMISIPSKKKQILLFYPRDDNEEIMTTIQLFRNDLSNRLKCEVWNMMTLILKYERV